MRYQRIMFLILLQVSFYTAINVETRNTIIWGPGLSPEKITMRARYFFIQMVDDNGKNFTKSPRENFISVKIQGQNKNSNPCRIWTQILDCKDGSFIIRYKLYETCYNFDLVVKLKDNKLPLVNIHEKGPVFEEECYCPNPSVDQWLLDYNCAPEYSQITEDLQPFPKVDFDKLRSEIINEFHKPHSYSICHYVIKDNRIYRKCYGQHVGFKIFSDSILLSLARKVKLPDVEFFMNLGDWPLVSKIKKLYPIFSWCGSYETRDIVLPTYDITESSIENMGRVMLDMISVQGNTKTPWNEKIEKVFWRGRDSRSERLDLIDIARNNPDLFNASITNFFFFKDKIDKYGPGEKHVSFFSFFQYKYQINIDGTVAAYRFPYLLAGDAVVFKQDSEYYEYFYNQLVPNVHFVPLKRDLSDLVDKVKWIKQHDDEALKIAKAGREIMRQIAMPQNVFCYHVSLLHEWSKRLQNPIEILEGMEEVSQPEHLCRCPHDITNEKSIKSSDEL